MGPRNRNISTVVAIAAVVTLALAADGATRSAESVRCSSTSTPLDPTGRRIDLSGRWVSEDGRYTMRQIGTCLWWAGGAAGTNVFLGNIFGLTVNGAWADVATGASGSRLTLSIDPAQRLLTRRSTRGTPHPARNWRRLTR